MAMLLCRLMMPTKYNAHIRYTDTPNIAFIDTANTFQPCARIQRIPCHADLPNACFTKCTITLALHAHSGRRPKGAFQIRYGLGFMPHVQKITSIPWYRCHGFLYHDTSRKVSWNETIKGLQFDYVCLCCSFACLAAASRMKLGTSGHVPCSRVKTVGSSCARNTLRDGQPGPSGFKRAGSLLLRVGDRGEGDQTAGAGNDAG